MNRVDAGVWLTEADVAGSLDLVTAIQVLRTALRSQDDGAAWTMEKAHAAWTGGTLHAIGGSTAGGLVGTKTWAHTAAGATPLLILWDAEDGRLVAVIEAFALGQLRTAAVTGLATEALSSPSASTLALIGSGRQAEAQVAAVAAVRPIQHVRVWSPTPENRSSFAARLARFGVDAEARDSLAEAVAGADVITTVTRSRDPFLGRALVGDGVHVNALGAITPERRELTDDLVGACGFVVADSPSAARSLSSELDRAARVVPLAEALRGVSRDQSRPSLFKAMGIGLADVALGEAVLARCASADERRVPQPVRQPPKLFRRSC